MDPAVPRTQKHLRHPAAQGLGALCPGHQCDAGHHSSILDENAADGLQKQANIKLDTAGPTRPLKDKQPDIQTSRPRALNKHQAPLSSTACLEEDAGPKAHDDPLPEGIWGEEPYDGGQSVQNGLPRLRQLPALEPRRPLTHRLGRRSRQRWQKGDLHMGVELQCGRVGEWNETSRMHLGPQTRHPGS